MSNPLALVAILDRRPVTTIVSETRLATACRCRIRGLRAHTSMVVGRHLDRAPFGGVVRIAREANARGLGLPTLDHNRVGAAWRTVCRASFARARLQCFCKRLDPFCIPPNTFLLFLATTFHFIVTWQVRSYREFLVACQGSSQLSSA